MPSSACSCHPPHLPSFPTRRSSDLIEAIGLGLLLGHYLQQHPPLRMVAALDRLEQVALGALAVRADDACGLIVGHGRDALQALEMEDRKSTRLNSSHRTISYAVFCLLLPPPPSSLFPYTTLFRSD